MLPFDPNVSHLNPISSFRYDSVNIAYMPANDVVSSHAVICLIMHLALNAWVDEWLMLVMPGGISCYEAVKQ